MAAALARLGASLPLPPDLAMCRRVAEHAEILGYESVWIADTGAGPDAFVVAAMAALVTRGARIGTAVVPLYTRALPVHAAGAGSVAQLAPGRFILGVGVSSETIVDTWGGVPFRRPLARMRESVGVLRQMLAGERVTFEGKTVRTRNFRLVSPPPRPVPIYVAALMPAMLELAGEIADGVVLNWIPPEAVPASIAHLEAGAKRAGRTLDSFEVAAFIRTCVTDDVGAVHATLARDITGYTIVDVYASFFRTSGFAEEVEAVNAAWKAGDRAAAVRHISPRVLDGLGVVGPEAACRERIDAFARAGVTMPVVLPFTASGAELRASLLRTLRAFG